MLQLELGARVQRRACGLCPQTRAAKHWPADANKWAPLCWPPASDQRESAINMTNKLIRTICALARSPLLCPKVGPKQTGERDQMGGQFVFVKLRPAELHAHSAPMASG